jgi:hypothetical protein
MSTAVTRSDFPEIRWNGHWIWVPEDKIDIRMDLPGETPSVTGEAHGLFRKTFILKSVPERAPARITADSRYVLYVNGQEVFRGPVRSQPRRMHYDLFDLAPYLKPGENLIAVHVKFYGAVRSFYIPPVPNTGLGRTGVLVFEANLGEPGWLISDDTWKATRCEAWKPGNTIPGGVPIEVMDGRLLPGGWETPDFQDQSWGCAQILRAIHIGGYAHSQPPTDPYGPLYPRPIAKLGGETVRPARMRFEILAQAADPNVQEPAARVIATFNISATPAAAATAFPCKFEVPENGAVRLMADMGRIVSGLVGFSVTAPAGSVFDLCYVEEPLTGKEAGFSAPHNGSRYIARGKDDRFEAFDSNGLRYIYLVVHGASGPVTVSDLAVREHIYPWQPGASFECSDPELNRLYTAGIRTVNLNSHDAFLDCPTREQRAWVGDSVVHQMVHLTTNLDWRLAWQYLNLGNSPRSDGILPMSIAGEIEARNDMTIPDWSLHWVHGVYNLYRFLGDREKVKAYLPVVERILRWYAPYQTSQGVLKDVTEWNLVDWASLFVDDTSSILTAIWARGLREFAEMAAWLEENASRRWAEGLYNQAKTGFEMFWDEERGTYVDYIKDGRQQKPISQVAGALAIVSGLAPEARWARIASVISDESHLVVRSWTGGSNGEYSVKKMMNQLLGRYEPDWDVEREIVIGEPFISYLVHDAIAQAGLADRLPDLYRRWSAYLTNGYDTIGECWGWGTHVHGWSCTVTKDLVFYTLGVTPAEPGYAAAHIAPRLGRLTWAKGDVPTPFGLIHVEVTPQQVMVDSPVPFVLTLKDQPERKFPAGKEIISC